MSVGIDGPDFSDSPFGPMFSFVGPEGYVLTVHQGARP